MMGTFTEEQYRCELARLSACISKEDAGKRDPRKSLAEKIAHNRERDRLSEVRRELLLNYFNLVPAKESYMVSKQNGLSVLESFAGFYIGTADDEGPISRESEDYWPTKAEAEERLKSGDWKQIGKAKQFSPAL